MAFAIRTENNYKTHALPDFESRIFAMWKSPILLSRWLSPNRGNTLVSDTLAMQSWNEFMIYMWLGDLKCSETSFSTSDSIRKTVGVLTKRSPPWMRALVNSSVSNSSAVVITDCLHSSQSSYRQDLVFSMYPRTSWMRKLLIRSSFDGGNWLMT